MIVIFVVAFLALPFVVFRGRTLRAYLTLEPITYLVAWLLWLRVQGTIDSELAIAMFATAKLALFSLFLATGDEVRWSPTRAALLAAIVYLAAIPAMTRVPIDGDEPYYLLVTESIVRDGDLDLLNQYRTLASSATRRLDLTPQFGDPVGSSGQQYSRHEPLLSLLLVPGYLAGGLYGALATMALFGALLARSTMRLFEDAGISDETARLAFPFVAFGPPILWYSLRIWPEVPAALFFVEAVRGLWQRRPARWIPALLFLSLIKLRFLLLVVILAVRSVVALRSGRARFIAALIVLIPFALAYLISGSASGVHYWQELLPEQPRDYLIGFFGLILDGATGIAFQAPFYLLGLVALVRWKALPPIIRFALSSSLVYIFYLLPRDEWHGGWSPPLRYIVVLMPFLGAAAAEQLERRRSALLPLISVWTIGLVAHGLAYPWRSFHIFNGENIVGEFLSEMFASDFSRLFPSFIRLNDAAIVAAIVFVLWMLTERLQRSTTPQPIVAVVVAFALLMFVSEGKKPGRIVEFEDAHVRHNGGTLHPPMYTMARYLFRGGWWLQAGESLSFLARRGPAVLQYQVERGPATIDLAGRAYELPPTGTGYGSIRVEIPNEGRVELRSVSGAVNLDRLAHD